MLFETEKQLHEYTGFSHNVSNYLWQQLCSGQLTDNDVVEIIDKTNFIRSALRGVRYARAL